ncbi:enoyl-CoA hydratase/isomerase family protein [Candidatus Poriferisodalis multihospitum]|uniref:enoyl-CoA hydratase/isomerase family protein n=1 Tax=Candidatus Poriferisodalis multihospitum TaxID=2983191 RepID=UPI002B259F24|nr:enoyl-CoA hydratase-related protein [Candidatus Poriferisodalis multihospitum]
MSAEHARTSSDPVGYETIAVDDDGGARTVTLNRPKALNAANQAMLAELSSAFDAAAADDGVRCLLLTGAGRAFCSGRDLTEAEPGEDAYAIISETITPVLERLWEFDKPTIAAVNGAAMGVGLGLALNCDVVIAADNARFSSPFANLGVALDSGGHYHLPRLVGMGRTLEMVYTADVIRGPQAAEWGLVNRSVAGSRLLAVATALAQRIAAGPALAFRRQKALLRKATGMTWAEVNEAEARLQAELVQTDDYREGLAAFAEKRRPRFSGR